jgi:hypothetical protein
MSEQLGTPKKRIELEDPDLDCPSFSCEGWLRAYGSPDTRIASHMRCSNINCTLNFVVAKFSSPCSICGLQMVTKEVIVSNDRVVWMHAMCYGKTPAFASCQRCHKPIEQEEDAVKSCCDGKDGYRHIRCAKKRALFDEESSGDSQTTTSSACSTPVKDRKGKKN